MENKPLVSVIMSSHNPQWARLRKAIQSLRRQTWENWELVLWDDGSSRAGAMALEQAALLDSRIRLYRGRENHGLGYGLNRCVERARGEYLARMDDDDVCFPSRLEIQMEFLMSHPQYQWVGSAALRMDETGVWGSLEVDPVPQPRDFLAHSPYIHPSVIFRRQVLEQAGGYSQSPQHFGCEDYELFFRLHGLGAKGYNLSTPLLGYWEDSRSYHRRTPRRRLREARLRWRGFQSLRLPVPWAVCGTLRPVVACAVPPSVLRWVKRHGG